VVALRQHAQRLSARRACSGGDWRALCADDEPMPAVLLWSDYGSRAECRGLDPQRGGGGRARGGLEQAQHRKRAGDHQAPHDAINGHSHTRQSKPPSHLCMRTSLPSGLRPCCVYCLPCCSSQGVSLFWIDDVQKKEKEVLAFVRGLDCQLDNLCHFLPQEMVKVFRDVAGRYGVDCLGLFYSFTRTLGFF
jgi:hypothetical protein